MSNTYKKFVANIRRNIEDAKIISAPDISETMKTSQQDDNAPVVLMFSPHPDDECLVAGLALRLQKECGWKVCNVAVTLGSNVERRKPRLEELRNACMSLDFELILPDEQCFEKITPEMRKKEPEIWNRKVAGIEGIIKTMHPSLIMFPHEKDWNGTHLGTNMLLKDALKKGKFAKQHIVETEYWGSMQNPNMMVEVPDECLVTQLEALSYHVGELSRVPYHLLLPAWMQDNVRRGAELVGGQGGEAPKSLFATLYRHSLLENGHYTYLENVQLDKDNKLKIFERN